MLIQLFHLLAANAAASTATAAAGVETATARLGESPLRRRQHQCQRESNQPSGYEAVHVCSFYASLCPPIGGND